MRLGDVQLFNDTMAAQQFRFIQEVRGLYVFVQDVLPSVPRTACPPAVPAVGDPSLQACVLQQPLGPPSGNPIPSPSVAGWSHPPTPGDWTHPLVVWHPSPPANLSGRAPREEGCCAAVLHRVLPLPPSILWCHPHADWG